MVLTYTMTNGVCACLVLQVFKSDKTSLCGLPTFGMSPHDGWNVNVVYQPEWWMDYVGRVLLPLGFTLSTEQELVDIHWIEPEIGSDSDSDYETEYLYDGTGTKEDPIVIDDD